MNSKRILSLVLAMVMVLGTFGTVFAAKELTADIEDVSIARAVERLAAFEIVDGMEDGKYHPELDVTREQFAKLVVEATGLGSAAQATGGSTRFKDVAATRWSAGYINVAEGQGMLKGYPDGTFRPDKQVTYAEAVTMLVRALGYKDEFLLGSWPGNYVAKAAETGITKGVKFSPSGFADRGAAALLVNNALDADVIKVTTYEGGVINYRESDVILMTEKLDIDKVENIRLIATSRLNDALDTDEIRILVLKDDTMIDDKEYDKGDEVEVDVVDGINIEALIGLEITGYFEDDLMVYSEIETSETSSIRGIAYDDEGDGTVLSLETFKYYDYATDARLFVNNEERTSDLDITRNKSHKLNDILKEYATSDFSYAYGNLVLEKGKITFLDLSVFEIVSGVVEDVNVDKDVIQYIDTWDGTEEEDLNLDDYDNGYHVLALDGSKMELKDIKVGDRIYFYEDAEDDEVGYVMVDQKDLVKGTLTEFRSGNEAGSGTRGRLYMDDKAYSLANDWTYSLDSMDSFVAANRFDDLKKSLDDVLDDKATFYLDTKGRVALLVSDVDETSDNYGVAVRAGGEYAVRDEVKLWVPEIEDTITYEIDEFENGIKLSDIDDNDIVKYDINKDGTIDILAIVYKADVGNTVTDGKDTIVSGEVSNITTKSVLIDGKYYFNINKSSYIDYSDYKANGFTDDEDLDALSWKDFEDTVVPVGTKVVLVTDGDSDDIEFMAFIDGYDQIASDTLYVGYLLKTRETSDVMTLTVMERKGEVEYKVTKTADKNLFRQNVERPIVYTLSGEGIKLKDPTKTRKDGVELITGLVDRRSGNDLYVNDTRYVMENNVVIWEKDDEIGKYDLVNNSDHPDGYPVKMLVQDGKVAVIAFDYDYKSGDTGTIVKTDGVVTYIDPTTDASNRNVSIGDTDYKIALGALKFFNDYVKVGDKIAIELNTAGDIARVPVYDGNIVVSNVTESFTDLVIGGDLTVNSVSTLTTKGVTVKGDTIVNGTIISNTTFEGDVTINGTATFENVTFKKNLTVDPAASVKFKKNVKVTGNITGATKIDVTETDAATKKLVEDAKTADTAAGIAQDNLNAAKAAIGTNVVVPVDTTNTNAAKAAAAELVAKQILVDAKIEDVDVKVAFVDPNIVLTLTSTNATLKPVKVNLTVTIKEEEVVEEEEEELTEDQIAFRDLLEEEFNKLGLDLEGKASVDFENLKFTSEGLGDISGTGGFNALAASKVKSIKIGEVKIDVDGDANTVKQDLIDATVNKTFETVTFVNEDGTELEFKFVQ